MSHSTRTDLVRSRKDRPSTIVVEGWVTYIAIHDSYYEQTKKQWRQKRMAAHPDAGGSDYAYRISTEQYEAWREREAQWYIQYGLLPPDGWLSPSDTVQNTLERLTEPPKQLSGGRRGGRGGQRSKSL